MLLRKRTQGTPPRVVGRACRNPQHKAAAVDGVRAVAEGTGAGRAATQHEANAPSRSTKPRLVMERPASRCPGHPR